MTRARASSAPAPALASAPARAAAAAPGAATRRAAGALRTCRPARGLTLVELVITLGLVALLALFAVPSSGGRLERERLKSAAHVLAADLQDARFEAARSGRPLHLRAQAGPDWCWSVSATPGCDCAGPAPAHCPLKTEHASAHPGVRLLDAVDARMDPTGMATAARATLQGAHGERLQVALSPLGRASVCAAEGAWPGLSPCAGAQR